MRLCEQIIKKIHHNVDTINISVYTNVANTYHSVIPNLIDGEWLVSVDADTGIIKNWQGGTTTNIHFNFSKIRYVFISKDTIQAINFMYSKLPLFEEPYWVLPHTFYINISKNGKIKNWNPSNIIITTE